MCIRICYKRIPAKVRAMRIDFRIDGAQHFSHICIEFVDQVSKQKPAHVLFPVGMVHYRRHTENY